MAEAESLAAAFVSNSVALRNFDAGVGEINGEERCVLVAYEIDEPTGGHAEFVEADAAGVATKRFGVGVVFEGDDETGVIEDGPEFEFVNGALS